MQELQAAGIDLLIVSVDNRSEEVWLRSNLQRKGHRGGTAYQQQIEGNGMRHTGRGRANNVQPAYAIMLCALLVLLSVPPVPVETVSAYSAHDPIYISGDENFTEGNGVVDGSGTPSDPYLITGWEITTTSTDPAIHIANTTASFVVKGLSLMAPRFVARMSNASSFTVEDCLMQGSVYLNDASSFAVEDCLVQGSVSLMNGCYDFSFVGNTLRYLWFYSCSDFRFESNTITGPEPMTDIGMSVKYSQDFVISRNELLDCGLKIYGLTNATITDNSLGGRMDISPWQSVGPIGSYPIEISGNTLDGEPIMFVHGQDRASIKNVAVGQLIVVYCDVVEIDNVELSDRAGIVVKSFQNATITISNCSVEDSTLGIEIQGCGNVTITRCLLRDCVAGVYINNGRNATIENNLMDGCNRSIMLESYRDAIIRQNMISNTTSAIGFYSDNALIHSNCFINVVDPGLALHPTLAYDHVYWNADYPLGGNYWSNYSGTDEFSGPGQDQEGADGFGDTPYSNGMAIDYYPLVEPPAIEFGPAAAPPSNESLMVWLAILGAIIVAIIGVGLILRKKR